MTAFVTNFLQVPFSPELVAIFLVYFVQGILQLARLGVTFFFKDELGLDPAAVAFFVGIGHSPWVIKPLYGFISDTIPLFGYKRRSYLVLCGLLGALSWGMMATTVNDVTSATIAITLGSLSTAFSDVVVDSIVVERARGEPQATAGSLQSLCWGSSAVGGIASAYFSGSLVELYGPRFVFGLTAVFPLLVSVSACFVAEHRVAKPVHLSPHSLERGHGLHYVYKPLAYKLLEHVQRLWVVMTQPAMLMPAVFIFVWQATPVADTAMFYFQTNHLGFTPEFLGRVRLLGSIASLLGVGLYNGFLKQVPLRKMLLWTALFNTALGSTQLILILRWNKRLGLSNELFVLGDSMLLTALGRISMMPLLVLAAKLCPEGVEATLFAALMSILNGGSFVGATLGALLTNRFGVSSHDFTNLAPLYIVCLVSGLVPLLLLKNVPYSLDECVESAGGDAKLCDV